MISEAFRNPDGKVAARIDTLPDSEICISIIVAAELRFGAVKRNSNKLADKIESALLRMTILPLEPPVDRTYAQVRVALERKGAPLVRTTC
jgi:tRNA(fMet)-specific endonuclease VapC